MADFFILIAKISVKNNWFFWATVRRPNQYLPGGTLLAHIVRQEGKKFEDHLVLELFDPEAEQAGLRARHALRGWIEAADEAATKEGAFNDDPLQWTEPLVIPPREGWEKPIILALKREEAETKAKELGFI